MKPLQPFRSIPLGLALALLAMLSACSTSMLQGDRIDYKSATKASTLEVPPDLTQLTRDNRYVVPGATVSASGYQGTQAGVAVPVAANSVGDVSMQRDGNERWLVVKRSPESLWDPVRTFWQENGFLISIDQPKLGIMETDWAENRAKLPQDFIRETLGKLFDSLYSTGERDKFRTRFERGPNGTTEIFISHRGMVEKYKSSTDRNEGTIWEPRPADPELEAEFLRRLMVRLGVSEAQSKTMVAAPSAAPTAKVATVNGAPAVQMEEGFDRAWRRVGLSLDRTGFTVEDRDRSKGLYFVRYVEPTDKKEPGFFSKLFGGGGKDAGPLQYRISLQSQGNTTTVSVLNAQGTPDTSANAKRIVQVIADDLK